MNTNASVPIAAMSQSQSHDMCTRKAITPACSATSSGCNGSSRRENGLPTIAATSSTIAAAKSTSPTTPSSLSTLNHWLCACCTTHRRSRKR